MFLFRNKITFFLNGVYFICNQKIISNSIKGGLSSFLTTLVAPKNRNIFPIYLSAGFTYEKLSIKRPQDFIILGFSYSKFSEDLNRAKSLGITNVPFADEPSQDFEGILELGYGAYFFNRLLFQPDVQYVIHPDGLNSRTNALVVGIHLVGTF